MSKQKLSSADLVVLSLLAEEPMHGYRIVSELDRRDAEDWAPISRPQVYYSIKKLAKMHLIHAAKDSDQPLGPDREIYQITAKGKKSMNTALSELSWARQRPPPPFLTWMALSSHLSSSTTQSMIEARRDFLIREVERERKTLKEFEEVGDQMITAGRLMVSFTIEQFESELKWLKKVLVELPQARQKEK